MLKQVFTFSFSFLITLFIFSPSFLVCAQTFWFGSTINDLDSTTTLSFSQEVSNWQAYGLRTSQKTTTCNNIPMLGGPGVLGPNGYFQTTYYLFFNHQSISFKIQLYLLDNWQDQDTVIVQFDDKNFTAGDIALSTQYFPEDFCGDPDFPDLNTFDIKGQFAHTGNSLRIRIISSIARDPSIASFGVGSVNLQLSTDTNIQEASCNTADTVIISKNCSCPPGTYQNPLNLSQCCSSLLSANVCQEPCSADQFYYFNESCSAVCPEPLISTYNNFGQYCNLPCSESNPIYWNQSCIQTCPAPLVQSDDPYTFVSTCNNPCNTGEYYYPDHVCRSSCLSPLTIIMENEIEYCNPPCENLNEFFYDLDGSCISECNAPNITSQETWYKKCTFVDTNPSNTINSSPALSPEEVEAVKTAGAVVAAGSQGITAASLLSAVMGGNPVTATLAGFVKMLPYIRYIKIAYPPKLQLMLNDMNSTLISFSFGIKISQGIKNQFVKYPLPAKFDEYQFHSSFIVNYFQPMTSLAILLGIACVISLVPHLLRRFKGLYQVFSGLKLVVMWNLFLMIFFSNLDGVVLNTSFELRTIHITSFVSVLSLIFCLLANVFAFFALGLACYIIKDIRKSKRLIFPTLAKSPQSPEEKWKKFQIFFKGSKDKHPVTHFFMIVFLLRLYLFNSVIAYLFDYPLVQAILIALMNITMLTYMLWARPFVSQLVLCQHTTDEIIMMIVNISLVTLAVLDFLDVEANYTRQTLGDVIIYSNITFSITANIYLIAYLGLGFYTAYQNTKINKTRGIIYWFTALLSPFESGGMEVEVSPEPTIIMEKTSSQTCTTESKFKLQRSSSTLKRSETLGVSGYLQEQSDTVANSLVIRDPQPFSPQSISSLVFNISPSESPKLRRGLSLNGKPRYLTQMSTLSNNMNNMVKVEQKQRSLTTVFNKQKSLFRTVTITDDQLEKIENQES